MNQRTIGLDISLYKKYQYIYNCREFNRLNYQKVEEYIGEYIPQSKHILTAVETSTVGSGGGNGYYTDGKYNMC